MLSPSHVLRLLGELDVVDDRPRLVAGHAGERLGERAAREHPALLELVERHVVDPEDDDVVRHRARPADLEARVDGRELGAVERAGGVEHDHRAEREQRPPPRAGSGAGGGWSRGGARAEANRRGALPGTDFLHSARSWPPDASRWSTTSCSTCAAPSACSRRSATRWPDADVFTAVYDERGTEGRFADRAIHTLVPAAPAPDRAHLPRRCCRSIRTRSSRSTCAATTSSSRPRARGRTACSSTPARCTSATATTRSATRGPSARRRCAARSPLVRPRAARAALAAGASGTGSPPSASTATSPTRASPPRACAATSGARPTVLHPPVEIERFRAGRRSASTTSCWPS